MISARFLKCAPSPNRNCFPPEVTDPGFTGLLRIFHDFLFVFLQSHFIILQIFHQSLVAFDDLFGVFGDLLDLFLELSLNVLLDPSDVVVSVVSRD